MLDLLLEGGTVFDGSGNQGYRSGVGVEDGKIVLLRAGPASAKRVIDADGLVLVPGFIDPHSHSDFVLCPAPGEEPPLP